MAKIKDGTKVKITKIHPNDAFFSEKEIVEGHIGTVHEELRKWTEETRIGVPNYWYGSIILDQYPCIFHAILVEAVDD